MSPSLFRWMLERAEPIKAAALAPFKGRGVWHLTMLATHPGHRRRGIASMLFEWGVQRADEEGAMIYLDATEVGAGLYEKYGCELVEGGVVEWEEDRRVRRLCMLRRPHDSRG